MSGEVILLVGWGSDLTRGLPVDSPISWIFLKKSLEKFPEKKNFEKKNFWKKKFQIFFSQKWERKSKI